MKAELYLLDAEQVAELIRKRDFWDLDLCERLCELAGLGQEMSSIDWHDGTGEAFEAFEIVVEKAARKLQVEIY